MWNLTSPEGPGHVTGCNGQQVNYKLGFKSGPPAPGPLCDHWPGLTYWEDVSSLVLISIHLLPPACNTSARTPLTCFVVVAAAVFGFLFCFVLTVLKHDFKSCALSPTYNAFSQRPHLFALKMAKKIAEALMFLLLNP